jgi:tRNA pseudouridine38-40 synthase
LDLGSAGDSADRAPGARYKAVVEYDGTAYLGFQRQRQPQTIQAALERALTTIASRPVKVTGAGRTDSGVHATGQVVSFDLEWRHGLDALQRAINVNLAEDIAVLKVEVVDPDFHPRYQARRRIYHYHIYNAPIRSPLRRRQSWYVSAPLAIDLMNRAAAHLVGVHDFATFGQPPQGDNTVRQVFRADWRRQDELLIFTVEANAFLYRMVRALVGSLKTVGEGTWTVEQFMEALAARDRSRSGTPAPAHGLYLAGVLYG